MDTYPFEAVSRLVELIYEAALTPEKWGEFLEALGDTVDAHVLNLSSLSLSTGLTFIAQARCDGAFLNEYQNYYSQVDPWITAGKQLGLIKPGSIALGEEAVTPSTLKTTEFYNDLAGDSEFSEVFRPLSKSITV